MRNLISVRILTDFDALTICHGMNVEQEPVFSYISRSLIDEHRYRLWVLAYTYGVICTCAEVLTAAYDQYKHCYATPDTILFAHRLGIDIAVVLSSHGNVREIL